MTFTGLGTSSLTNFVPADDLHRVLHEKFQLSEFRPKQKEVIDLVLSGKNTLALLPTGYGKSLCYQVPSQVLPGATIVISPLIALMQDQLSSLNKRGVSNATVLNSSLDADEYYDAVAGIKCGRFKLIYVAPERLESPRFRQLLQEIKVSLLVIDEAHCISQWGHDFRPQYRNMKEHLKLMPDATILALTATATPTVQRDIGQNLGLPNINVVIASFDRPNLRLEVECCSDAKEKDDHVLKLLRQEKSPAIVYTSSRKETEALSRRLTVNKLKAVAYHAGMPKETRYRVQKQFEEEKHTIIVSTVAFGMGVDKSNIRRVIHYNMPGSLENYFQEAGRAGRDGNNATCTLLYQPKDIYTQRWLMERNYPDARQVSSLLSLLRGDNSRFRKTSELASALRIDEFSLNSAIDLLRHLSLIQVTIDGIKAISSTANGIDMTWLIERKERDSNRLDKMVDYANALSCRRKLILQYFGQEYKADCSDCDNCSPKLEKERPGYISMPPEKENTSSGTTENLSHLEQVLMDTVTLLNGKVGRTTIAQVLSGSKAKKIQEKKLDQIAAYAKFPHIKTDDIILAIDKLIEDGKLRVIPGMYPKLVIARKKK
ncbi:ATP-dependent DNA helicase RecQ [bacterium]|nr:ATP-dependent DNA helicase RecQ [bacterium]